MGGRRIGGREVGRMGGRLVGKTIGLMVGIERESSVGLSVNRWRVKGEITY